MSERGQPRCVNSSSTNANTKRGESSQEITLERERGRGKTLDSDQMLPFLNERGQLKYMLSPTEY